MVTWRLWRGLSLRASVQVLKLYIFSESQLRQRQAPLVQALSKTFPTFLNVSLRTGMDLKKAAVGEQFSKAELLRKLKFGHFLAWNLSWVKPKSNERGNPIRNPLKIDKLTAATLYIHSRPSFYLKGSRLEVLHLLLLPVDEVPVVCEDSSASFPELQEDCRWNTWTQWCQVFYMTISVSVKW